MIEKTIKKEKRQEKYRVNKEKNKQNNSFDEKGTLMHLQNNKYKATKKTGKSPDAKICYRVKSFFFLFNMHNHYYDFTA